MCRWHESLYYLTLGLDVEDTNIHLDNNLVVFQVFLCITVLTLYTVNSEYIVYIIT